jgi:hypothetical protein
MRVESGTELATQPVEHLSHDTAPADAAEWLADNGYDAAPVYENGDPVGFLHKADVTTDSDGDTLTEHLIALTIDHMISGDTSFSGVLSALIPKPVYFLGGHTHVTGILTRADLNTAPARMYLFDRITYLEEHLRELILSEAPDWKNTPVTADELDDIEKRYEDAQTANVALTEIHYAQFSTLETIVSSVEACWRVCGFTSKGEAGTALHTVTELRNDVAHASLLVENTDSNEFLSDGRTTENLHDTLETINDVITTLQDAGFAPGTATTQ